MIFSSLQGHTDFSLEVSSSLQCCDGCLLVVDAVEGVSQFNMFPSLFIFLFSLSENLILFCFKMCARTHQIVREAHSHQLVPILVINKIDRLCTGLCLTPTEAYLRFRNLIESVNAACAAMLNSKQAQQERGEHNVDEKEESHWTFEPQKGNVIFGSALYGFGFTVPSLARSLFRSKTLPIKPIMLKQCLFGDFKYKLGKLLKWKQDSAAEDLPLFAEFGLQPVWDLYEGVATAASTCGLSSSLFADGRIVATQKKSPHAKIKSDTPGTVFSFVLLFSSQVLL
jgi:ribosome assembly protein 1